MGRLHQVRTLYKTILRLHTALPKEIKDLGDLYVKSEFKRHKKCNDAEANIFMNEWIDYAFQLSGQLGVNKPDKFKDPVKLGNELDPKLLNDMRDEQIAQLYELMKSTKHQNIEEHG